MPTSKALDPSLLPTRKSLSRLAIIFRKRRLDLGLLQRELAERLGVTESTVTNWERNRTAPELRYLPGIIALLGFDPRPAGVTLADRLVAYRTSQGLTQEAAARLVGRRSRHAPEVGTQPEERQAGAFLARIQAFRDPHLGRGPDP